MGAKPWPRREYYAWYWPTYITRDSRADYAKFTRAFTQFAVCFVTWRRQRAVSDNIRRWRKTMMTRNNPRQIATTTRDDDDANGDNDAKRWHTITSCDDDVGLYRPYTRTTTMTHVDDAGRRRIMKTHDDARRTMKKHDDDEARRLYKIMKMRRMTRSVMTTHSADECPTMTSRDDERQQTTTKIDY